MAEAVNNLPILLDAAEKAERYEAALLSIDRCIAIRNYGGARDRIANALAPEPEKENEK
jgi:hypothetical protein